MAVFKFETAYYRYVPPQNLGCAVADVTATARARKLETTLGIGKHARPTHEITEIVESETEPDSEEEASQGAFASVQS